MHARLAARLWIVDCGSGDRARTRAKHLDQGDLSRRHGWALKGAQEVEGSKPQGVQLGIVVVQAKKRPPANTKAKATDKVERGISHLTRALRAKKLGSVWPCGRMAHPGLCLDHGARAVLRAIPQERAGQASYIGRAGQASAVEESCRYWVESGRA